LRTAWRSCNVVEAGACQKKSNENQRD
jgi:hypothetical protein